MRCGVKRRIVWVVLGKNGAGVRKVRIEDPMFRWRVEVANFEAVAVARLRRGSRAAGVAILQQFGVAVQIPDLNGAFEMGDGRSAHADFRALGLDQEGNSGTGVGEL